MLSNRLKNILKTAALLSLFAAFFCAPFTPALADGIPTAWGINLQQPGSPIQDKIHDFHNLLLWIISTVSVFVLVLLIIVIVRFNKRANPNPSATAHNSLLEVVWTLVPCLILAGVAFVSFPLLYYTERQPKIDLTLKVTGHQWYWSYEYPDQGDVSFDSHAIWDSSDVTDADAAKLVSESEAGWLVKGKALRMLEVDNRVVLPVGKNVRIQIAGTDVEHSWFLPSLGVNRMAVPGRLSEVWMRVEHEGVYYGQCSMICGNGHGYMPIVIEGVSQEAFDNWVKAKKTSVGMIAPAQQFANAH